MRTDGVMVPGTGTSLVDTPMGGSPRPMGHSKKIACMEMTSMVACMPSWLVEGHDRIRAESTSEMPFQNPFHVAYRGNSWVVRWNYRCDTNWSGWVDQGD